MSTSAPARFLDLHILQSVPYSNLNRDDTNSVKKLRYGGVTRTRVSSQCWKRSIRLRLEAAQGDAAMRTRRLADELRRFLTEERGWAEDLATRAGIYTVVASSIGAEPPKKKSKDKDAEETNLKQPDVPWGTKAMVYIPASAVAELAEIAEKHQDALAAAADLKPGVDEKVAVKTATAVLPREDIDRVLRSRNGVINLTGRMLAELDGAAVDGAVQVAHAMTTHATGVEIDYFSAVDDITEAWGGTGSAHMGRGEYSAGTFYRYLTVDLNELIKNCGDLAAARNLTAAFVEAAITAMPHAKKNSTAPNTIPDLVAVAVRADRPVSYASAFEAAVPADAASGFAAPSITALTTYASAVDKLMGPSRSPQLRAYASITDAEGQGLGERLDSIDDLAEQAVAAAFAGRDNA